MPPSNRSSGTPGSLIVPVERIVRTIVVLRGQRVLLDADLAALYGVPTGRLNEQVKRNHHRFPADFAFRLTGAEVVALRSQIAISNIGRGGRRYAPMAFTEHGAVMPASVLNSPSAVATSIEIVRAFVRLRQLLESNADLARRLAELEQRYDGQFKTVFEAIRDLMAQPAPERKRIIFKTESRRGSRGLKSRLGKGTPTLAADPLPRAPCRSPPSCSAGSTRNSAMRLPTSLWTGSTL